MSRDVDFFRTKIRNPAFPPPQTGQQSRISAADKSILLSLTVKKVKESRKAFKYRPCGTFIYFMNARYAIYFLVCEQIFLILAMGMICLDVQKPKASCRASVISVLV